MRMFQPMHKNQDPVLWSVVHTWNGAQINEKISTPFPKLCVKVFYLSPVSGSVGNQSHGSEIPIIFGTQLFFSVSAGATFCHFHNSQS